MSRRICCIASSDSLSDTENLLKEIRSRIKIDIPLLKSYQSVIKYDIFVFVLSKGAINNADIRRQVKEACDLNKTFLPIIIGGNWWKSWYLLHKYRWPNFHSDVYLLNNMKSIKKFYTQLMSLAGAHISGDPFGKTFVFITDKDCKIIRNQEVIAEVASNVPQDVTLFIGNHCLQLYCKEFDVIKSLNICVDTLDNEQKEVVTISFVSSIKIRASLNCSLYEEDRFISKISKNQETVIYLLSGKHKLKFLHPKHKNLNRYITIRTTAGEDKGIIYDFPQKPKECNFDKER